MEIESNKVDYQKWDCVILASQVIIASFVFVIEIVNNTLLYVTRSQGYSPDNIVQKLIRYLILTTLFNLAVIIISQIVARKSMDSRTRRIVIVTGMVSICTNVAFSHYQFPITLVIFIFPIMVSILYEKVALTTFTLVISFIGQSISIYACSLDPEYNTDLVPSAIISHGFLLGVYVFARLILNTLLKRRIELGEALIEAEKTNAAEERVKLSLKMLETLARALDAKDKYTNGHSSRVAAYATKLAQALGWDEEQIELLKYQALLHDIGKIGVPDSILNKPNKLTGTEFSIIKSHTLIGADILKDMTTVKGAKHVAKFHHERYDGGGYPTGICGDEIPLNARIIGIADAYDAMSSDRIYRKTLSREVIREELLMGRGKQFDPELLDVFLKLFDEHKLNVRAEASVLNKPNSIHEYVIEDIETVIRNVTNTEKRDNTLDDFDKFYIYMRNIGLRYNQSIEVITVSVKTSDNHELTMENDAEVSQALELAIKKNIRAVDVYFRYSDFKHVIILLNAGIQNIDVISKRIAFDFEQIDTNDMYELQIEINENIEKKEDSN